MDSSLLNWLESLAAKQPTPGGGAAAGLAAATAAALVGMVSIYTTGPKWYDREVRMQEIHNEAANLRSQALELMQADEQAFTAVGAAYKLPKKSEDESAARHLAIQTALEGAAKPPRQIATLAAQILKLAEELVKAGNPNVLSDVAVAASFARAALESAIVNIEINEKLLANSEVKQSLQLAIQDAEIAIAEADNIVTAVRASMGQS